MGGRAAAAKIFWLTHGVYVFARVDILYAVNPCEPYYANAREVVIIALADDN